MQPVTLAPAIAYTTALNTGARMIAVVQRLRIFILVAAAAICWPRCGAAAPSVAPAAIELIPPGTRIEERAPEPWTHIIVKSQPRVTAGDMRDVSATQIGLAGKYFMATIAQVAQAPGGGFELARLASGIGVDVNGADVIISPDTAARFGARVGFQGGILLKEMYKEQQTVRIILRSPECAVYDTPIVLRRGDVNGTHVLRYAVVVDAATGELNTLAWLIDIDRAGEYRGLAGHLQWLPPNMQFDCQLYVDSSEYFLGIPNDRAFACLRIPPGKMQVSIPDKYKALLAQPQWTASEATTVELLLRKAIATAAAAAAK